MCETTRATRCKIGLDWNWPSRRFLCDIRGELDWNRPSKRVDIHSMCRRVHSGSQCIAGRFPQAISQLRLAAISCLAPWIWIWRASSRHSLARKWKHCRSLGNCRNSRNRSLKLLKTLSLNRNMHHLLCMNAACLTPNKPQGS